MYSTVSKIWLPDKLLFFIELCMELFDDKELLSIIGGFLWLFAKTIIYYVKVAETQTLVILIVKKKCSKQFERFSIPE